MKKSRRGFVKALTVMASFLAAGSALGQTQIRKPTLPKPPTPGDPQEKDKTADASDLKAMKRAGVERLYQLSSELRDEMQKTSTTNVLSVRMYKKTEEIEKLAKQLKSKARGG
jgi:hypothetical protein